jgi:hypothetical protein
MSGQSLAIGAGVGGGLGGLLVVATAGFLVWRSQRKKRAAAGTDQKSSELQATSHYGTKMTGEYGALPPSTGEYSDVGDVRPTTTQL